MRFCGVCGRSFPDGTKFCRSCGQGLLAEAEYQALLMRRVADKAAAGAPLEEVGPALLAVKSGALDAAGRAQWVACVMSVGRAELARNRFEAAARWFLLAVDNDGGEDARRLYGESLAGVADALVNEGKQQSAIEKYQQAIAAYPTPVIEAKRDALVEERSARGRRTRRIAGGTVALVAVAAVLWRSADYFGYGELEFHVDRPARIALSISGHEASTTEGVQVAKTGLLRSRTPVALRVEKEGYDSASLERTSGYFRSSEKVEVRLTPRLSSLKVTSKPVGARVIVHGLYGDREGTAPAVITDVFALPSEIEVKLADFTPWRTQRTLVVNDVMDLGEIVFESSLEIDSMPSGADVFLDGKKLGVTPFKKEGMPARKTRFVLKKKHYEDTEVSVVLEPMKSAKAMVHFGLPLTDGCEAHRWIRLPPMKTPRGYACAVYDQGKVYVFGGVNLSPSKQFGPPVGSMEIFDFATSTWSDGPALPEPVSAAACGLIGNEIFVYGGRTMRDNTNAVAIYDPARSSWRVGTPMSALRAWHGGAVLDGKAYAVGGVGVGYRDDAEVMDANGNWSAAGGQLGFGRYFLGAAGWKGHLYVAGGDSWATGTSVPTDLIEVFDPTQGQWSTAGHLPAAASPVTLAFFDPGPLLAIVGSDVYRLSPTDFTGTKVDALPPHLTAHDTTFVVTPYGLFAAGGGGWGPNIADAYLCQGQKHREH